MDSCSPITRKAHFTSKSALRNIVCHLPGFYYHFLCFIIFLQSFWTGIALPHHLCNGADNLIHMYYYLSCFILFFQLSWFIIVCFFFSSCSLRCLVNSFKLFHALSMKKKAPFKKKKKKKKKK